MAAWTGSCKQPVKNRWAWKRVLSPRLLVEPEQSCLDYGLQNTAAWLYAVTLWGFVPGTIERKYSDLFKVWQPLGVSVETRTQAFVFILELCMLMAVILMGILCWHKRKCTGRTSWAALHSCMSGVLYISGPHICKRMGYNKTSCSVQRFLQGAILCKVGNVLKGKGQTHESHCCADNSFCGRFLKKKEKKEKQT